MEHGNTIVERRSGLTLYQTQRREGEGGNSRASWWMRGWQQMRLDGIRNHQTSTAKPLRSGLELCRPHRSGVRFALESDCRGTGGAHLQVRWGASQHHLGDGTGDSYRLAGDSSALHGGCSVASQQVPPALAQDRYCRQAHCECPAHVACIPSQHAAIVVTSPKGSKFGLVAGSAGHADAAAAVAALRRGNIANAFRRTPSSTSRLSRGPHLASVGPLVWWWGFG